MRNLNVSAASTNNGFPLKAGTFEHLQSTIRESVGSVVLALVGGAFDASKAYILYGCKNIGFGNVCNIAAGAVYVNGEIFLVDAANFTFNSPNVIVVALSVNYYSGVQADPVEFTDGVQRNIHEIRKAAFVSALPGSGLADYSDVIDLNRRPHGGIGQLVYWSIPGGQPNLYTYFGGTLGMGNHPLTLGWAIANGSNGTDDYSGLLPIPLKAGDANFGTLGNSGGAPTVEIEKTNLPNIQLTVPIPSSNTSETDTGVGRVVTGSDQFEPTDANPLHTEPLGDGTALNVMNPYRVTLLIQRLF